MSLDQKLKDTLARVEQGGAPKYHDKNREQGKLFARERVASLLDEGSFLEDAALANALDPELPADGVVTGTGTIQGRPVAIMANDSTVKAGSWGRRTVEKILRIQETARRLRCPLFYLVDSAGARITDQIEMFPGRRGAGRIFHNQVALSGMVPQICLLFGPSAAGGAYIPAFCDVVVMVEGNASMYLGSPRMAEMVIGEKVTLEDLGGARMHCSVSGCGDVLVKTEQDAIAFAKRYIALMPSHCDAHPPAAEPRPAKAGQKPLEEVIPVDENKPFDIMAVIDAMIDEGSFVEIKKLFAKEIITGLARIDGRVVGIVANQPKYKGGVLFVDSADKAARFIWLCDAYNIPLVYLADVPGFMIGTVVERQGIIRAGAKMIAAVSEATVPKLSVIVRKAYGAGLYAMCGPAFSPDECIALPTASIAVMGPSAAVNAVYYNKIQAVPEGPERDALVQRLRDEYRTDIDLTKLASELVIDGVIPTADLRREVSRRLARYADKIEERPRKKHLVPPV
ncbi:acyl-CoA carboxylase subunit beta [Chondromyces apiculatus]|uniref:Methylcrotonyl-CoA carboxylase carboxyl transferase subunit n=1 Tax=Chondromyces apiculatus DSM 436 TaxID=1192034 RepID=A0A017T7K3_9BACT|nr:acyl-CoA carboxylase subunit beta [Chondromyces apiculatus]EYF05219.1 Methylcrotonyl-CoA carboxylase carboxyl transferase subunit [Chondromyces apiculatus DSM 436]